MKEKRCEDCKFWVEEETSYGFEMDVCSLQRSGYFQTYPSVKGYPNRHNNCKAYKNRGK